MLPPPLSFVNHGLFVYLHPSIGETTPQSIVVVRNPSKLSELKKKKPRKVKWEIN